MDITDLIPHIEALIFASDKPLSTIEITDLLNSAFGFMEDKISVEQVTLSMEGVIEKYNSAFYSFEIRESGGGWQFLTKKAFHKTIGQLNGDKFMKRLSVAALETLSIIAYKQPVTKGEIEAIRGVSADYAIQKLLEKELVIISGRNEKQPGHPLIYATSKTFMDYFGINSAEDLPKISEVWAEQLIEPTIIANGEAVSENHKEMTTPLVIENEDAIETSSKDEIYLKNNKVEDATLSLNDIDKSEARPVDGADNITEKEKRDENKEEENYSAR